MAEVAQQNDVYQVKLVGRMEGQETNQIWYFKCVSGAGDSDVLLHLITVLLDCFINNLLPVLSSSWTLEKIVWKRVTPTLGPEIVSLPQGAAQGGGAAQALPSFCSAVMSIRSAQGGRSHRGRTYFCGIPEGATINSTLDPGHAFWAGLIAFALCCVSNFIIGDPPGNNAWHWMIYSRKLGGSSFPFGANGYTPMKELLPVSQLGTTRSRKVGRGS